MCLIIILKVTKTRVLTSLFLENHKRGQINPPVVLGLMKYRYQRKKIFIVSLTLLLLMQIMLSQKGL